MSFDSSFGFEVPQLSLLGCMSMTNLAILLPVCRQSMGADVQIQKGALDLWRSTFLYLQSMRRTHRSNYADGCEKHSETLWASLVLKLSARSVGQTHNFAPDTG